MFFDGIIDSFLRDVEANSEDDALEFIMEQIKTDCDNLHPWDFADKYGIILWKTQ